MSNELDKKLKKIVDGFGEWSDVEDVDRRLKLLNEIEIKFNERKNNYLFLVYLAKLWNKENNSEG